MNELNEERREERLKKGGKKERKERRKKGKKEGRKIERGFIKNSRKSVRWSAVPVPCLSWLWLKERGEQGSGPKGVDDLCFHTGEFFPSPPPSPPQGSDLDL